MKIQSPVVYYIGKLDLQERLLMTVISCPCLLHEEYADISEKEQQVIEILPESTYLKISKQQKLPERITIELSIQQYDLDKMLQLKIRLQRIKDLVTKYTSLSIDRMSCLQSPIKQTPYTLRIECILNKEHTGRELVWKQNSTELEKVYVRWYQVFMKLCCWWESIMSGSVIGTWKPITSSTHEKISHGDHIKNISKELANA